MKKTFLVLGSITAFAALVACKAKVDLGSHDDGDGDAGADPLPTGGTTPPGGGGGSTADAITVLSKVHINPGGMVIDAHNVYWTDANQLGGVYAVAKTGGAEVEVVTCADCSGATTAVDSTSLYVATSTTIAKVPLNFDPPSTLATLGTAIGGVARNADHLFWIEAGTSIISPDGGVANGAAVGKSIPLDGGAVTTITMPPEVNDETDVVSFLFASPTAIYASHSSRGILRIPYDASPATLVPVSTFPRGLASDDVDVYYADGAGISKVPVTGGTPTPLAAGEAPYGLALDGDYVYWTDGTHGNDGRVFKMKKDGSDLVVLADHQESPTSIAVDETSVYWIAFDEGKIKKLSK